MPQILVLDFSRTGIGFGTSSASKRWTGSEPPGARDLRGGYGCGRAPGPLAWEPELNLNT
ncbi:hypothetical protein VTN02DRAFT_501 [Thermoascus thermophilus]